MLVKERIARWQDEELDLRDIALAVASAASIDIKRIGDDPLIEHAVRVARIVESLWPEDKVAQIAALLHDIVEDTSLTLDFIRSGFGDEIANAVDALTRRDKEAYHIYLERLLVGRNVSAIRVKFGDSLDNSSLPFAFVTDGQVKYSTWLHFRIKYRQTATILMKFLKRHEGNTSPASQVMGRVIHVWSSCIDREATDAIRAGKNKRKTTQQDVFKAVMGNDDEYPREDTWTVTPWTVVAEKAFAPVPGAEGFSKRLADRMFTDIEARVTAGGYNVYTDY